ncbi:MAG TPA: hypothetical protein ENH41_03415 [Candidatus Omnitrophica bacterium]|nr:hypothetical protein [Candidatus Omnitrophota bacterium]
MNHRPVCVKCEVDLRPENNEVTVAELFQNNSKIYRLWSADKWRCPICGVEVVIGFGQQAWAEHYQVDSIEANLEEIQMKGQEVVYSKEVLK